MSHITSSQTRSRTGLILLAYIAFISLGLPDGLLGVAWPTMRQSFSLPLAALGGLLIASLIGYLTSSFLSGAIMTRLGVGWLLAGSCFATGSALIGYTLAPAWIMILGLGILAGFGAGAIDAGINTYIAAHFGERLMQWLHASFGVGITLGPLIMTTGINLTASWRTGYLIVGAAQIILAACFAFSVPLWRQNDRLLPGDGNQGVSSSTPRRLTDYRTPLFNTLLQPGVQLSIVMFFLYTGMELTLGHWTYSLLTLSRGINAATAGLWAGSYWGLFTVGRIIAGLYANRAGVHKLVVFSLLGALSGALLVWINPTEWAGLLGIITVGFSIAPIFPGLVSGTSERVSIRHAANTIGMQISAAGLGGAAIPGLAGALAERFSLEVIPVYLTALILLLITTYLISMIRKPEP